MKRVLLITLMVVALLPAFAGVVVRETMKSTVLGADRSYQVYLPLGYDTDTTRSYPVLYLLHGLSDDDTGWTTRGGMQVVIDELIASGEVRPMIVVMPCAGGSIEGGAWNGYFNMPGWSYETFFFTEFMPYIEGKYRIKADKKHRAVAGLSMGGGGSVVYAQHHPELFAACYAFSAWFDQAIDEKTAAADTKIALVYKAVHEHATAPFVNKASEEVRQKLRTVRWFVDCGDDDFLFDVNIAFYQAMKRAHIPCELRVRNGAHSWEYWHTGLRLCLPFISRNFAD